MGWLGWQAASEAVLWTQLREARLYSGRPSSFIHNSLFHAMSLKQGHCWGEAFAYSVRPPSIVHFSAVKVARVADLIGSSVTAQERDFVLVSSCSGEFRQHSRA